MSTLSQELLLLNLTCWELYWIYSFSLGHNNNDSHRQGREADPLAKLLGGGSPPGDRDLCHRPKGKNRSSTASNKRDQGLGYRRERKNRSSTVSNKRDQGLSYRPERKNRSSSFQQDMDLSQWGTCTRNFLFSARLREDQAVHNTTLRP